MKHTRKRRNGNVINVGGGCCGVGNGGVGQFTATRPPRTVQGNAGTVNV